MFPKLRLVSHKLCPFVQRAVIVAMEKRIPVERVDIDLANKPDWFLAISPTGNTPLLEVTAADGEVTILFESAVIAEYLDEISDGQMLPGDALQRARQRAWIEFASATLGSIAKFYSAAGATAFEQARTELLGRLGRIEREIKEPWFNGDRFSLVDAAFGPALRYLEVFRSRGGPDLFIEAPMTETWSACLQERPSIIAAVSSDYPDLLVRFVIGKGSILATLFGEACLA